MDVRRFRSTREQRLRLRGFDYASAGLYFVTVVTARRACSLGRIVAACMELSMIGRVVEKSWLAIGSIHAGVRLGAFVVMPNHVHGLLQLPVGGPGPSAPPRRGVARGSLGAIVGGFKAGATRGAGCAPGTLWQSRFYDRIVRSDDELERIEEYIASNVERWPWDPLNSEADPRRLDGPHVIRRQSE